MQEVDPTPTYSICFGWIQENTHVKITKLKQDRSHKPTYSSESTFYNCIMPFSSSLHILMDLHILWGRICSHLVHVCWSYLPRLADNVWKILRYLFYYRPMAIYCRSIYNFIVEVHTQTVIGLKMGLVWNKSPSFTPCFWLLACNTAVTEALKKNIANKARIERLSLNFNMLFIKKQITKFKKMEFKQCQSWEQCIKNTIWGDFRAAHLKGFRLKFPIKGHCLKEVVALIMRYVLGEMALSLCGQALPFLPMQPLWQGSLYKHLSQ